MLKCESKIVFTLFKRHLSGLFKISDEVKCGLAEGKPVVALESTIITHGMPFPENIKCAEQVEAEVRKQGAIPATVAILNGLVKIGLEKDELYRLGDVKASLPIKTSRRDIAYVVSNRLNGGTTVSGTLLVANKIGIPIFATGGIGGVHRQGELTFDISADLIELGKSKVAVICSGVKSILDIPKTLEYLETQGVFVGTFGPDRDFPAFYTRKSQCQAPYNISTAVQAADMIFYNAGLDTQSGLLFAVPIPHEFSLDDNIMNRAIEEALKTAADSGIKGKEITPFLLSKIADITKGKSLEANMALIKNNAKVAAQIAIELAKLKKTSKSHQDSNSFKTKAGEDFNKNQPVVIGGSNLDCCIKLKSEEIKLDGRIHYGKFSVTGGGVARNICEALYKLGCPPAFISVLGDDMHGEILKSLIPHQAQKHLQILPNRNTAQCTILLEAGGDCACIIGDMEIHQEITPSLVRTYENVIKQAPLIVFDGNLEVPTIQEILKIADEYKIPVLFEPTDLEVSVKPFKTNKELWKNLKFITPNFNELKFITSFLNIPPAKGNRSKIKEAAILAQTLSELYIDNVIVTLGADGLLIARKGAANEPLRKNSGNVEIRFYPTRKLDNFVNVSGAGDCLASGLIVAMLEGLSEENCVSVGFAAASTALHTEKTVAGKLFDRNHPSWETSSPYKTITV